MKHLHTILAVAVLVAAATVVGSARADIKTQKDPTFEFTGLKTFGWKTPPGEVKIFVSTESNARAATTQRQYEPILMQTVDAELVKRGYTPASGAAPDLELTYYVLIWVGSSSQYAGQFLPTNAQWGIPMFPPATTSFEVYPQGSIVLDIGSPSGGPMVWRGIAEAKVEAAISETERTKRVQGFMRQLVSKIPKRK